MSPTKRKLKRDPGPILTVDEAAEELRMSAHTIYQALRGHVLPGIKIGTQWRILRKDLDAFLEERRIRAEMDEDDL